MDEVDMEGVENDAPIFSGSAVPTFSGNAEGAAPTPTGNAEGDKTHDDQYMISAATAFPYEYIEGSEIAGSENDRQISHISVVKFIREKRAQRRVRYSIATMAAKRVSDSVPEGGKLDTEQVDEAVDVLNDAHEDMKDYTRQILEKIDLLFQLVHAALRKDREIEVSNALNVMFNDEHQEKIAIAKSIHVNCQSIRGRMKRKEPPIQNLEAVRLSQEKDPDVALQPGTLSYKATPADLDNWISSFVAYVNNGKGVDRKTVVAYVRKFLDEEYRGSDVYQQITEDKSTEEIMQVLKDDLKVRYPLATRRMKLFHLERRDDEEVHHFITRVKEDAKHAECDKLPFNDIVTLIVVSRCRVPELIKRWGMKKEIDLQQVCIDADLYARNQKLDPNLDTQTTPPVSQPSEQINYVAGNSNDRKGKRGGKGKRGRGGGANRGGYNDHQGGGGQYDVGQGPPRYGQGGQSYGNYGGQGYSNQGGQNFGKPPYQSPQPFNQNQQQGNQQQGFSQQYNNQRNQGRVDRGYGNRGGGNSGARGSCNRCHGVFDYIHGAGHWQAQCTTQLICEICRGPHVTKRCVNQPQPRVNTQAYGQRIGYNPQQGNQTQVSGFRGQRGPQPAQLNNANSMQPGSLEDFDPAKHSQVDGYTNGDRHWGNSSGGVPINTDE